MNHDLAIFELGVKIKLLRTQLREYLRLAESSAFPDHSAQARDSAEDCQTRIDSLTNSIKALREGGGE